MRLTDLIDTVLVVVDTHELDWMGRAGARLSLSGRRMRAMSAAPLSVVSWPMDIEWKAERERVELINQTFVFVVDENGNIVSARQREQT